jgi:hypothetical protein
MTWGKINPVRIKDDTKPLISIELIAIFEPKLLCHIQNEIETNVVASGTLHT